MTRQQEKLKAIFLHFGVEAQSLKLQEELYEFLAEYSKYLYLKKYEPTQLDAIATAYVNMVIEYVDFSIVYSQLTEMDNHTHTTVTRVVNLLKSCTNNLDNGFMLNDIKENEKSLMDKFTDDKLDRAIKKYNIKVVS